MSHMNFRFSIFDFRLIELLDVVRDSSNRKSRQREARL